MAANFDVLVSQRPAPPVRCRLRICVVCTDGNLIFERDALLPLRPEAGDSVIHRGDPSDEYLDTDQQHLVTDVTEWPGGTLLVSLEDSDFGISVELANNDNTYSGWQLSPLAP